MNNLSYYDLEALINTYNPTAISIIKQAYQTAEYLHHNQRRASGEPYIIHPLNVAYILANLHADTDTICAALLHDTIEDTDITKEQLEKDFNYDVANLVDGVSKISRMNFKTKDDQENANTRKIILGLTNDVRIILIKLADRLHNMRTLQFKTKEKQKENAMETLEIFVPLAYFLGVYHIKNELANLSLMYLNPNIYQNIEETRNRIASLYHDELIEMKDNIKEKLIQNNIYNEPRTRLKSIYSIYKASKQSLNNPQTFRVTDIHDLFSIKIIVKTIENCYKTIGIIHQEYTPINNEFKDYICHPKTNKYQSLHTTITGFDKKLVQAQIRTFPMDKIAENGITEYWNTAPDNARKIMQQELKKYQLYDSLVEIDKCFSNDLDFVKHVKTELFKDNIQVYNTNNNTIIDLPINSTIIDLAYKTGTENDMVAILVNNELVPINYTLKNNDQVTILTKEILKNQSKVITKTKKLV